MYKKTGLLQLLNRFAYKHRLRVFKNKLLRKIFGSKTVDFDACEDSYMRVYTHCYIRTYMSNALIGVRTPDSFPRATGFDS
jgi:hypothetical protein